MLKTIISTLLSLAPLAFLFIFIPILKGMFFGDSESKKDIKKAKEKAIKNHFRQLSDGRGNLPGYRNPPPPQRIKNSIDDYMVRGGKIVKKRLPSSVKIGEKMSFDYESDSSIEEEFGTINTDAVWNKVTKLKKEGKLPIPTKEDIENEPTALANSGYRESNKPKKKNFKKGANPDFL
jgi:hypothetical protein